MYEGLKWKLLDTAEADLTLFATAWFNNEDAQDYRPVYESADALAQALIAALRNGHTLVRHVKIKETHLVKQTNNLTPPLRLSIRVSRKSGAAVVSPKRLKRRGRKNR